MTKDTLDPTGIIGEAYKIENITPEDCRGIFFDWALKVPMEADTKSLVADLLARHGHQPENHPMTIVLKAALAEQAVPRRKGGRAARLNG